VSDARDPVAADAEWNAGDLGCGELVLELRGRMLELAPDAVLRLIATDPGAPADIPAWCRMTGHELVSGDPPMYLIRRKEL
jgi:tRNA 2-thiouridine synthesizing protein A